jgi:uncharacterized protein (DUF1330 family)
MSFAYLIGHITIKDTGKWDEYRNCVPATLAPWSAELVLRGKHAATLSGTEFTPRTHSDVVVIRFPDQDALNGWFSSAAYQALIPLRQQAADVVLSAYDA